MNICITGAAGFIGSHLSLFALQQNHSVIGIDNYVTGKKRNIETLLNNSLFRIIEADVSCLQWKDIPHADIVFHLASPASPVQYKLHPVETLLVNSLGTKHMLDYAKKHQSIFVFASTSEVYGDPLVHPQTETYWGNVNPNGARSCYDEAKRFGEALCMSYVRQFSLPIRIARIFNTFGPHMDVDDGRVISNFVTQALQNKPLTIYGSGEQTRSLCFVSDLIEGLWLLATKPVQNGEIVNLGNPEELTVLAIAQRIKRLTHSRSSIQLRQQIDEDDPKKRKPDISKAQRILGWKPKITLDEALEKTIAYFKTVL